MTLAARRYWLRQSAGVKLFRWLIASAPLSARLPFYKQPAAPASEKKLETQGFIYRSQPYFSRGFFATANTRAKYDASDSDQRGGPGARTEHQGTHRRAG